MNISPDPATVPVVPPLGHTLSLEQLITFSVRVLSFVDLLLIKCFQSDRYQSLFEGFKDVPLNDHSSPCAVYFIQES